MTTSKRPQQEMSQMDQGTDDRRWPFKSPPAAESPKRGINRTPFLSPELGTFRTSIEASPSINRPLTLSSENNTPTPTPFVTSKPWSQSIDRTGSPEPEADIDIGSNDEEDEFGLPTMTGLRWKNKSTHSVNETSSSKFSKAGLLKSTPSYLTAISQRNSEDVARNVISTGDIAEERDIPTYPNAPKFSSQKILKPQYKELLRDPANSLHFIPPAPLSQGASQKESDEHNSRLNRLQRFRRLLQEGNINMKELRELSWSGIPSEVRAMTWQLLLGYLPTKADRRITTLERKRQEYLEGVRRAFDEKSTMTMTNPNNSRRGGTQDSGYRGLDEAIWHQISIDVPRTNPHLELYGYEATQRSLERILYVWAIRHPASGYVQGINDLVSPFWQVFLGMYITDSDIESGMDPGQLPRPVIDAVEADTFWCLTKLLDGIQDNYIRAQPGIQRQVRGLQDLTTRIDRGLADHLKDEGVEFIQFSFRWMNCLLMREISVKSTIRMWDTYMAEERGFSDFHLYVCAAFLVKWTAELLKMDFQEIMMFLQALPTKQWTEKDIELLLSEAFIWKSLFGGSQAHLR